MRTVRVVELGAAVPTEVATLAVLRVSGPLGVIGWLTGTAIVALTVAVLARALRRDRSAGLGPADRVTLLRAVLVATIAALVADGIDHPVRVPVVVALATVTLVLDAVDGWVARHTRTTSVLGWWFDMEVDAFLILVLSVAAATSAGPWVLAIGLARYLAFAAGRVVPWLGVPVPPRYWRKPVAAMQGIVLTVAVAGVLPPAVTTAALLISLVLLAESFGRDVWWQWHLHRDHPVGIDAHRQWFGAVATVLAGALVWAALVAPDRPDLVSASAFLRLPIEALVLVALVLLLPARGGRAVALAAGVLLGVLSVLRVLDLGFFVELDRPFDPIGDVGYFGPAYGVLSDSVGGAWAVVAAIAAVLLGLVLVVALPWSAVRLAGAARRQRARVGRVAVALAVAWAACAAFGVRVDGDVPLASHGAAGLAVDHVRAIDAAIDDRREFAAALGRPDPASSLPSAHLLDGLRGKDVIFAFVESYGRVAVQDSAESAAVDTALRQDDAELRTAGFASRSAFLTSPTFGGISWLAHATLQSGTWVDSQQRYDQLMGSNRESLGAAFARAGWRTVADIPSNTRDWADGTSYYHYDKTYDARNVGYAGPKFGYAQMPDQYTLSTFAHRELAPVHRAPVMAEIDLVSSHTPWAPLPRMVAPDAVGDGSVYEGMPAQGRTATDVWRTAAGVQAAYGQSIRYSLASLVSFVRTAHDPNLVVVLLGDHQPSTTVSGYGGSHDVPVTVLAHDRAVLARTDAWGWQDGMLPRPSAPVWRMDAFRDRFLAAFGPGRS